MDRATSAIERNWRTLVGMAAMGVCVLVATAIVNGTAGTTRAQGGAGQQPTRWEYKVDHSNSSIFSGDVDTETKYLQDLLDRRGADGWEFVGRVSSFHATRRGDVSWFVFRRPKLSGQ